MGRRRTQRPGRPRLRAVGGHRLGGGPAVARLRHGLGYRPRRPGQPLGRTARPGRVRAARGDGAGRSTVAFPRLAVPVPRGRVRGRCRTRRSRQARPSRGDLGRRGALGGGVPGRGDAVRGHRTPRRRARGRGAPGGFPDEHLPLRRLRVRRRLRRARHGAGQGLDHTVRAVRPPRPGAGPEVQLARPLAQPRATARRDRRLVSLPDPAGDLRPRVEVGLVGRHGAVRAGRAHRPASAGTRFRGHRLRRGAGADPGAALAGGEHHRAHRGAARPAR